MKRAAAAVLAAVLAPAAALYGWGQKGHRIVADIAQEHLTEVTKRNVQSLIGNNTLASVANWADEIRPERDETYNWHFVDIPKDASGFSDSRDCYRPQDTHKGAKDDHQNCVVDRIEYFKRVLGDKNAPREDRIEALKFIVHFVGDIHQPFHAIGEAKGGNGIHITEFGSDRCGRYPCNLHSAWDSGLIEHTGMDEEAYVAHLDRLISQEHLRASGNPSDWANESFALARAAWVNDGGSVDEQYYEQQIKVVDERLALAGLRVAALLNEVPCPLPLVETVCWNQTPAIP
jgi:nuclease S1